MITQRASDLDWDGMLTRSDWDSIGHDFGYKTTARTFSSNVLRSKYVSTYNHELIHIGRYLERMTAIQVFKLPKAERAALFDQNEWRMYLYKKAFKIPQKKLGVSHWTCISAQSNSIC